MFLRFSTMVLAQPDAALRNIRSGLESGDTTTTILRGTVGGNPRLELAKDMTPEVLPPPGGHKWAAGPALSMADEETVRAQ